MSDAQDLEMECEKDLKEIATFYGGWDELRKAIDRLEDNENEARFERWSSGGETRSDVQHRLQQAQKLK